MGYCYLSDEIVLIASTDINKSKDGEKMGPEIDSSSDSSKRFDLRSLLQHNFLMNESRLSKMYRNTRKIMNLIVSHASDDSLQRFEGVWQETIVSWIYLNLKALFDGKTDNNLRLSSIEISEIIEKLSKLCQRIQKVITIDFCVANNRNIHLNSIFMMAFRRLHVNQSYEITKLLAVSISSLMDNQKNNCLQRQWQEKVNTTTQLIRVSYSLVVDG